MSAVLTSDDACDACGPLTLHSQYVCMTIVRSYQILPHMHTHEESQRSRAVKCRTHPRFHITCTRIVPIATLAQNTQPSKWIDHELCASQITLFATRTYSSDDRLALHITRGHSKRTSLTMPSTLHTYLLPLPCKLDPSAFPDQKHGPKHALRSTSVGEDTRGEKEVVRRVPAMHFSWCRTHTGTDVRKRNT